MSDGLSLSFSTREADKALQDFKLAVGLLLILDAAAALALLIGARGAMRLMLVGDPASPEWARLTGVLLLIVAGFVWSGRAHPNRAKLVNVIAIAARFVLGVALALTGGRLLWVGLAEMLAGLAVGHLYYRFFAALVMSRP